MHSHKRRTSSVESGTSVLTTDTIIHACHHLSHLQQTQLIQGHFKVLEMEHLVLTWVIISSKCMFLESLCVMQSAVGVLSVNIELTFLLVSYCLKRCTFYCCGKLWLGPCVSHRSIQPP